MVFSTLDSAPIMEPGCSTPVPSLSTGEDDQTWALVASLALMDIEDVQSSRKGKGREDQPISDEELAFQLYAEEVNALLTSQSDLILARSVDSALRTDRGVLKRFASEEAAAARDREYALKLSRGRTLPTNRRATTSTSQTATKVNEDTNEGLLFRIFECDSDG